MTKFKIGINMAGAISAGAYTAGVLDFLTEALDGWYAAKKRGEAVPMHDVSIEVFSGASAGGMCAAISAVMLQQDFEHIHDTTKVGTNNRFFESWVNKIDISELLRVDDLKAKGPVVSLLDSTVIGSIAEYALKPENLLAEPREYVSPNLNLFLSLTNLRGIPYSLDGAAPGSVEENTLFFGDHIRFQTSRTQPASLNGTVRMLNLTKAGAEGGWDVLQTAAMATGAFPVFLAPRVLQRYESEFIPPHWHPVISEMTTPPPNFPADFQQPFETLNVDGGVTNNDPFNFAHDYLTTLEPVRPDCHNDPHPVEADRAVITVAPFPTTAPFVVKFDPAASASIFSALPRLFSALIAQSRFFGESLSDIMEGVTFSRFIIAPSDDELTKRHLKRGGKLSDQPPALQCASLGAFGGFFEKKFRRHDYALGRRNCQRFLSESFVLPATNELIKVGLAAMPEVPEIFRRSAPGTYGKTAKELEDEGRSLPAWQADAGPLWIPIIPLCTEELRMPVERPKREKLKRDDLEKIVALIMGRFKEVVWRLLDLIPNRLLRWFLSVGQPIIRWLARKPLREALIKQLGEDYEP